MQQVPACNNHCFKYGQGAPANEGKKDVTQHSYRLIMHAATGITIVQVVEEGYEFFAKRQLVTIFSAPNYCGEFENAGAMMSVDETLMCSFQVRGFAVQVGV
jgi:hypothetical protein